MRWQLVSSCIDFEQTRIIFSTVLLERSTLNKPFTKVGCRHVLHFRVSEETVTVQEVQCTDYHALLWPVVERTGKNKWRPRLWTAPKRVSQM